MDRITKLGEQHLEPVVMHDFLWALIEEQASDRAHQHQEKNRDSWWDICQVEAEIHSISQGVVARVLSKGRPMVCDFVGARALTLNLLWEVMQGVFREALHLDSLDDFDATEADLKELKDKILSIWKSNNKSKTSTLGPTFVPSTAWTREKKFTLGSTFLPSSTTAPLPICQNLFARLGYTMGGVEQTLTKPTGPTLGIPFTQIPTPFGQGTFPTLTYEPWGSVTGYNFDPMMGQPLRPTNPYSYPFMSQYSDILLSTSLHPSLADMPPLLDEKEDTSPLVVEPSSCSSHIVMSGMVPTVTISSAGAEMLLSSSPRANPRMSTSIAGPAKGDVQRVIQWRPSTSANAALANVGVGWGQVIAQKLWQHGGGRGHVNPSPGTIVVPPMQSLDRKFVDAEVEVDLPPPIQMNLPLQGPPYPMQMPPQSSPWRNSQLERRCACAMSE